MEIDSETRERLAAAMEARAVDLDMTWREVAAVANLSYETLRAVRRGTGAIPPRTRRKIDRGLSWPQGTVNSIIEDPGFTVEGLPVPKVIDPARAALLRAHEVYVERYGLDKANEMLARDVREINNARSVSHSADQPDAG